MKIRLRRSTDERGVTAVEYALVIGLVSLVVIGAAVTLGAGFTTWAATLVDVVSDLFGV